MEVEFKKITKDNWEELINLRESKKQEC